MTMSRINWMSRAACAAVVCVVVSGARAGEQLLVDSWFSATSDMNWSFSLPAGDGRLVARLYNPDASADGTFYMTNETLLGAGQPAYYNNGMFYGTLDEPIFPNVYVTEGIEEAWYAGPVRAEWGASDYSLQYGSWNGTGASGTNRLQVWYSSEPLSSDGLPQILSLVSQPQQANSASVTFDAGDGGALILDMVQTGGDDGPHSGGFHSLYIDGRGVLYKDVGTPLQIRRIYTALNIDAGWHTIKLQHEDSGWSDNIGVRQTDIYFDSDSLVPEPTTLVMLGLGGLILLHRRRVP